MDASLKDKEKILTKVATRIEKECGFKNGAFVATFILLFMDPDTWTIDKSILARVYQAIDIIEHNNELKQLFGGKENALEEESNDCGGSAETNTKASTETSSTTS